jgi:SAM-dependent MidA family methyltransferase
VRPILAQLDVNTMAANRIKGITAPGSAGELPLPDAAAQVHSERLQATIREVMATAGGRIDFARFMELALYAPGLGYYSAGSRKFGEAGDFVTAPELSTLFSRALARQCREVLARIGGDILEFGAGSGVMAADILAELERLDALPEHYFILEISGDLRARQRETINQKVPRLAARVVWLNALPEAFEGVVLGNEVLDAMPVHRFCIRDGEPHELFVMWDGERFILDEEAPDAALYPRLQALHSEFNLGEGYESEINLLAAEWVSGLGRWLKRGVALLIDYGFPRAEYYHPQRSGGTLMCHYRHRAHADALTLIGLQDITAHVDFTAVADAAVAAGLSVRGFANQANFLLGCGLTELLATQEGDALTRLRQSAEVKTLTLPAEMGELFKVIALSRGWEGGLRGFALRDERSRL